MVEIEKCRIVFRRGIVLQHGVQISSFGAVKIIPIDSVVSVRDMLVEISVKDSSLLLTIGKIFEGKLELMINGRRVKNLDRKF